MPVNVDTVYQTVQALANKEQRGYLTPQEFNLLANQAQLDIYEQYFYDLNAFRAQRPEKHELGDSVSSIMHKLVNTNGVDFKITNDGISNLGNGAWKLPNDSINGKIFFSDEDGNRRQLTQVPNPDEILDFRKSKWHQEGSDDIVYHDDGHGVIRVWNLKEGNNFIVTPAELQVERIIGKPSLVFWGYVIVNESPVYNNNSSQPFALHQSEQPDLVAKILKLAGISMEDQEVYQAGATEESLSTQQENK